MALHITLTAVPNERKWRRVKPGLYRVAVRCDAHIERGEGTGWWYLTMWRPENGRVLGVSRHATLAAAKRKAAKRAR